MVYKRKTKDVWEVLGWYSSYYGWECVNTVTTTEYDAREALKTYCVNESKVPFKLRKYRVRVDNTTTHV
jgi:hypothetical protein